MEIKVNKYGITLIEINLRPGGDRITKLIELSTGIKPYSLLYQGSTDILNKPVSPIRYSKICFFYLTHIESLEKIRKYMNKIKLIKEFKIYDDFTPVRDGILYSSKDRSGYFILSDNEIQKINDTSAKILSFINEVNCAGKE